MSATLVLAALGLLSTTVYVSVLRLDLVNGLEPVAAWLAHLAVLFGLYAGAVWCVLRTRPTRGVYLVIVGFALVFRALWLPAGMTALREGDWARFPADLQRDLRGEAVVFDRHLLYDDDVWRFLWEGHAVAHRGNPYRDAPADLHALVDHGAAAGEGPAVWEAIAARVNHAHLPTIYPPLAQGLFVTAHAVAPGSLIVFKALLVALDVLTILLVTVLGTKPTGGRAGDRISPGSEAVSSLDAQMVAAVLYAWNPLVVKAIAGSAHIDGLVGLAVVATAACVLRGWRWTAAGCLGLGILAKLSPLVLVPLLVRRVGWRPATATFAMAAAAVAPFLAVPSPTETGLAVFAGAWHFNALPWDTLRVAVEDWAGWHGAARGVGMMVVAAVVGLIAWQDDGRRRSFSGASAMTLGALVVLGPVVMPWYLLWLLPVAAAAMAWPWVAFSGAVCLAFLVMVDGRERLWWLVAEYAVLAAVLWRWCWADVLWERRKADRTPQVGVRREMEQRS